MGRKRGQGPRDVFFLRWDGVRLVAWGGAVVGGGGEEVVVSAPPVVGSPPPLKSSSALIDTTIEV